MCARKRFHWIFTQIIPSHPQSPVRGRFCMVLVPLFQLLNYVMLFSSTGCLHTLSPQPAVVSHKPLCPVACWQKFNNWLSGEETHNRNQNVLCSTCQLLWCKFSPHGRCDAPPLMSLFVWHFYPMAQLVVNGLQSRDLGSCGMMTRKR